MRKEDYDRIIVETNEKMEKVIRWYQDNKEWIDTEEFRAPMESGAFVLKEEGLEVTFESKGDVVELAGVPAGEFGFQRLHMTMTRILTSIVITGIRLIFQHRNGR